MIFSFLGMLYCSIFVLRNIWFCRFWILILVMVLDSPINFKSGLHVDLSWVFKSLSRKDINVIGYQFVIVSSREHIRLKIGDTDNHRIRASTFDSILPSTRPMSNVFSSTYLLVCLYVRLDNNIWTIWASNIIFNMQIHFKVSKSSLKTRVIVSMTKSIR